MKLLIVLASVRKGRAGEKVAHWFVEHVKTDGRFEPELVDLKELDLPYELPETLAANVENSEYEYESTRKWAAMVRSADAVVFVSPEYNHGYPASLKNAIDHLYHEWQDKPASVVNYGADTEPYSFAAFSMVAAQIKLRVPTQRVAIGEIWAAFSEDGKLQKHADYYSERATAMLDALVKLVG